MSHVCTIEVQVRSIPALESALKELGCTMAAASTFRSYQSGLACDFAVTVPGVNFQVGVQKQADGTFTLAWDTYGGAGALRAEGGHESDGHKLLEKFGDDMVKLRQMYSVHSTEFQARQKGMAVTRAWQTNGTCRLTVAAGRKW